VKSNFSHICKLEKVLPYSCSGVETKTFQKLGRSGGKATLKCGLTSYLGEVITLKIMLFGEKKIGMRLQQINGY
jgi:hypothetical protein